MGRNVLRNVLRAVLRALPATERRSWLIELLTDLPAAEINKLLYNLWPAAFELATGVLSETVSGDPTANIGRDGRMLLQVLHAAADEVVESRGGEDAFYAGVGGAV
jgi:hypothetical protein